VINLYKQGKFIIKNMSENIDEYEDTDTDPYLRIKFLGWKVERLTRRIEREEKYSIGLKERLNNLKEALLNEKISNEELKKKLQNLEVLLNIRNKDCALFLKEIEKINQITNSEVTYKSFIIPKYLDYKIFEHSYSKKQSCDVTFEEAILFFLEFSK
jgi:predicted RNase H-like nuclease (RuvC/YqgF family)